MSDTKTVDLPHGEGQAAIIIPSGRPAEAPHCYGCDLLRNQLLASRAHAELAEGALSEAQARIAQLEAEAEMATRMLAASGREQARLRVELELRVAKAAERLPAGHTSHAGHRAASLGRTR